MTEPFMPPVVSTQWLEEHMFDDKVRIVDASWYLPGMQRNAEAEYKAAHIPGAVRFDLDAVANTSIDLPHVVASSQQFASDVGKLGISETHTIVIYDGMGLFSAARVWWNFRIMGAANTYVLSGGLPKWVSESRPLAAGLTTWPHQTFNARFSSNSVVTSTDVLEALGNNSVQIVDMRPAERFSGAVAEPRPGMRSGHMPGAINLPFSSLTEQGELISPPDLHSLFSELGLDVSKPIISTCGSGVTAPILNLALTSLGANAMTVYDGSWAEWGAREDLPIVAN